MGVGIHGEPGRKRMPLLTADQPAKDLLGAVLADFGEDVDGEVVVAVNGFGGTPLMELYLVFNTVNKLWHEAGVNPAKCWWKIMSHRWKWLAVR